MNNEEHVEGFIQDIKSRGWSQWTVKACKYTLGLFLDYYSKGSFSDVGIGELKGFKEYLSKRGGRSGEMAYETLRKHINNMASFFEYLEDEDVIDSSPVGKFRRRYLTKGGRKGTSGQKRQLVSVGDMRRLIGSIIDPMDRALLVVLAKTGLRADEMLSLDVKDVDVKAGSIRVHPTKKRDEMNVFIDEEGMRVLSTWIKHRRSFRAKEKALFINSQGTRLRYPAFNKRITSYAEGVGLHDPSSDRLQDRLTAHCFRHFFTTNLLERGMRRDHVVYLRGDSRSETIDIYHHILESDVQAEYNRYIPRFVI